MAAGYGGSDGTDIQEQTKPTIAETANLFESAYDYPLEIKEIFADRVARIENLDPEIDGIVFIFTSFATFIASVLFPSLDKILVVGPIKIIPFLLHAWAKSGFSDKNP